MLLESEHFSRDVGTRTEANLLLSDYDKVMVSKVCWPIDSEASFICCWFRGIVGWSGPLASRSCCMWCPSSYSATYHMTQTQPQHQHTSTRLNQLNMSPVYPSHLHQIRASHPLWPIMPGPPTIQLIRDPHLRPRTVFITPNPKRGSSPLRP